MSDNRRQSPKVNVDAPALVAWLDNQREYVLDLDGVRRLYINNCWVNPVTKRVLRRYRNNYVNSLRPSTATTLLSQFNLTLEDFHGRS